MTSDTDETRLDRWLEEFHDGFLPLERELALASWEANVRSDDANDRRLEAAEEAYRRYLASPQRASSLAAIPRPAPADALRHRQHDVARRLLEQHRMDEATIAELVPLLVSVESSYSRFRARVDGREVTDNDLKRILRETDDTSVAREAWEASKQIGAEVRERVLRLVEIRNRHARSLGHENFQTMSLGLAELEPGPLFELLDRLGRETEGPFRDVKAAIDAERAERFGIDTAELRPWHYADPFFQSAPPMRGVDLDRFYAQQDIEALSRRFFDGVGLGTMSVLGRSDLYERERKCQHAFCTHIDRSGDVRVLCNIRPNEEWMGVMLHELGHAVYELGLDGELPAILREPAHTFTTEAIAMLFGRLSRDARFLAEIAGADPDDARAAAASAREELRRSELVFVRWALVVVLFERELYRDPSQDLDALWRDLVREYQRIEAPADRRAPDWAAKIHVATVPVYYQNYILGELGASQLERHLLDDVLGGAESLVGRPEVGRWLDERFFRPSNRVPWSDLFRVSTGEPLDVRHFLAQFAEPASGTS